MARLKLDMVEVYLFRRRGGRRVEFLALQRSRDRRRLPGVWQPVTGKLERGETALAAAVREVREETGFTPRRWWQLETWTAWYRAEDDSVSFLPLFAAEVGATEAVRLSREHCAHRFLSARAAGRLYLWDAQRRGLEAVRGQILRGGALARALDVTLLSRRRPRPRGEPSKRGAT